MSQLPSLGRIVLVRSARFLVEFPAIVVRTYSGVSEDHCDVQVFTDEEFGTLFLAAIGPQEDSSKGYGWRWPPRVDELVPQRESVALSPASGESVSPQSSPSSVTSV